MVVRAGGYFFTSFMGYCGVTQGDPLSPTIFNVVLDEVLRYWVTMVKYTEDAVEPVVAYTEGFGWNIQCVSAYFYSEYGIITSTLVAHIQRAFGTLTELFCHVGLHTNVENTVSMNYKNL